MNEHNTAQDGRKKSEKRKWIIRIAALIIIILLLLLGLYKCGYLGGGQKDDSGIIIGAGVKEGRIDKNDGENQTGEGSNGKSEMRVKLNGKPVFADGESKGNLNIENPAENVLYMSVEITLDDTGEVIYESGAIPPNHYIDNDKLTKVLQKGEYEATAHVTLFDSDYPDTEYNSANFKLTISIKN